jgi:RNA polymerase sigma-70 factor (ECF subfamily)
MSPDLEIVPQDEWLSSKEVHQYLQQAIEQLPPVFKTMISLYHSEEISYEEIAEITGLPWEL